jgi:hypothetical protein
VLTIRTNPLSFLEKDAGAMLGIGYQFHPRWSISIDPMWIFYSPYKSANGSKDEKEPVSGYKVRADLKYYFRDYVYGKRGGFIGLEFHYKDVTARKWDSFGMNCVNGQCDFYQRVPYDEVRTEVGFDVKAGLLRRLWSSRWTIELYSGVGLKYKRTREKNLPAAGAFPQETNDGILTVFRDDGVYPILPTGAKLVYRIF